MIESYTHVQRNKDGSYTVGACCDGQEPDSQGFERWRLQVRELDGHHVLERINTMDRFNSRAFGVVDGDKREDVEERLYEEAMRLGRETATECRNTLVDLVKKAGLAPV